MFIFPLKFIILVIKFIIFIVIIKFVYFQIIL